MRKTVRGAALVAAAGALALGVSACGDDDEESAGTVEPPVLSMSVSESGKKATLKAPAEAKSGVTKIALKNDGKKTHEGQIVRVEGGHTAEEVIAAVAEDSEGVPEWIVDGGGVGIVEPGRTGEVIQDLEPGRYVAFDSEGADEGQTPATAEFTVTDEQGTDAGMPETDAKITAKEYAFETEGLKAGENTLTFENTGKELHHAVIVPVEPGASFAKVKSEFAKENGNPPVDFEGGVATAVIDGGYKQVVNIPMEAGKYAFVCFIPDRAGGPPHVAKGMVTEVDVK